MDNQPQIFGYDEILYPIKEQEVVKTEIIPLKPKFGFMQRFVVKTTKQIGVRLIKDKTSSNGLLIHRGGYSRPIFEVTKRIHLVAPKSKFTF
jgi:hypothetical protein